jgi:hypothetical protein
MKMGEAWFESQLAEFADISEMQARCAGLCFSVSGG